LEIQASSGRFSDDEIAPPDAMSGVGGNIRLDHSEKSGGSYCQHSAGDVRCRGIFTGDSFTFRA